MYHDGARWSDLGSSGMSRQSEAKAVGSRLDNSSLFGKFG